MINTSLYKLTESEHASIASLLTDIGSDPSLTQLWGLMNEAWERHGCSNSQPDPEALANFYNDPVWLLNGIFSEQDSESIMHRESIANQVTSLRPRIVADFGGGFGTLARLLATKLSQSKIVICEPYPPQHGIESCQNYPNIQFKDKLDKESVDVLVSTDVLEHVADPIALLSTMVQSVKLDGHLLIATCFEPVIKCHLPCTFHLRYSFNTFCNLLGLEVIGPCRGSHAIIYKRSSLQEVDWKKLREVEKRSKQLLPLRNLMRKYISPWKRRVDIAATNPKHFFEKIINNSPLKL